MSGSTLLNRLLINPDAYWAWSATRQCADEGSVVEPASEAEAASGSDDDDDDDSELSSELYPAARLAELPAQLLRQYGLAVRMLSPTRPDERSGTQGSGRLVCSRLSELLAGAKPLPGCYDEAFYFRSLLEVTRI